MKTTIEGSGAGSGGVAGVFAMITAAMVIVMFVISVFGPKTREQTAA
jgi:hypothetical protein